jgi:hypothetical protein
MWLERPFKALKMEPRPPGRGDRSPTLIRVNRCPSVVKWYGPEVRSDFTTDEHRLTPIQPRTRWPEKHRGIRVYSRPFAVKNHLTFHAISGAPKNAHFGRASACFSAPEPACPASTRANAPKVSKVARLPMTELARECGQRWRQAPDLTRQ